MWTHFFHSFFYEKYAHMVFFGLFRSIHTLSGGGGGDGLAVQIFLDVDFWLVQWTRVIWTVSKYVNGMRCVYCLQLFGMNAKRQRQRMRRMPIRILMRKQNTLSLILLLVEYINNRWKFENQNFSFEKLFFPHLLSVCTRHFLSPFFACSFVCLFLIQFSNDSLYACLNIYFLFHTFLCVSHFVRNHSVSLCFCFYCSRKLEKKSYLN